MNVTIRGVFGSLLFGTVVLAEASCSADKKGAVMVSVATDLDAPKDIDQVGLFIAVEGRPLFTETRAVAPDGTVRFPATIAVAGDPERPLVLHVRAVAFSKAKARVLRDTFTTIPTSRIATLRVPLQFLSVGSAVETNLGATPGPLARESVSRELASELTVSSVPVDFDLFLGVQSDCPAKNGKLQTRVAGSCKDADVDAASLPDFDAKLIFGGGDPPTGNSVVARGYCFDAKKCFATATSITPNPADCTVSAAVPVGVAPNIGLRTTDGSGACVGGACYVPLDHFVAAKTGERDSGWWSDADEGRGGTAIHLPSAVCAQLALTAGDPNKRFDAVVLATACDAWKNEEAPLCGLASSTDGSLPPPASALAGKNTGGTTVDGGGGSGALGTLASHYDLAAPPTDLAVAAGHLFVATEKGGLLVIAPSSADRAPLATVLRTPSTGCSSGGRHQLDVASVADGSIFVADAASSSEPGCGFIATGSFLSGGITLLTEPQLGRTFFDVIVAPTLATSALPLAGYFLANLTDGSIPTMFMKPDRAETKAATYVQFEAGCADPNPELIDVTVQAEIKRIKRATFFTDTNPGNAAEVIHDFAADGASGTIVSLTRDASAFYALIERTTVPQIWRYDIASGVATRLLSPPSTEDRAAASPPRGLAVDDVNVYFARDGDVAYVPKAFSSATVPTRLFDVPATPGTIGAVVAFTENGKRKVACIDAAKSAVDVYDAP